MTKGSSPGVAILIMIMIVLSACSDESEEQSPYQNIYGQPEYIRITDSISRESSNAALYFSRGLRLERNNLPEAAVYDFRKAWELQPKEEYGVALSNLLLQKHPDSAIRFLNEALKTHEANIFYKLNLARAYEQANQPEKALNVSDEILQRWPGAIDAYLIRASILEKKGEATASLETLRQAYSLNPSDVELAYTLAFRYAESRDERALALSDSLIRMDSSGREPEPYYFKGVYFLNTGNTMKALEFFQKAKSNDYYFLDAYLEEGRIYYDQKRFAKALKVFQLAATVSPAFAESYYWTGRTQEAMGDTAEAKLNYLRAYGLDKSLTEAKEAADKL